MIVSKKILIKPIQTWNGSIRPTLWLRSNLLPVVLKAVLPVVAPDIASNSDPSGIQKLFPMNLATSSVTQAAPAIVT